MTAAAKVTTARKAAAPKVPARKAAAPKGTPSPKRVAVRQLVRTVDDVVTLIVTAGKTADLAAEYGTAAARDFTLSAIGTCQGIAAGFSTVEIARQVKARVAAGEVTGRHVYTVNSAVGFHGMTGRFLLLPGDMPPVSRVKGAVPIDPVAVQSVIKRVGQVKSAAILDKAGATKSSAWSALRKADSAKSTGTKGKGNGTKGKGADKAPATFGSLMRQALPLITGAGKRDVTTADDVAALTEVSAALATVIRSKRRQVATVKAASGIAVPAAS